MYDAFVSLSSEESPVAAFTGVHFELLEVAAPIGDHLTLVVHVGEHVRGAGLAALKVEPRATGLQGAPIEHYPGVGPFGGARIRVHHHYLSDRIGQALGGDSALSARETRTGWVETDGLAKMEPR